MNMEQSTMRTEQLTPVTRERQERISCLSDNEENGRMWKLITKTEQVLQNSQKPKSGKKPTIIVFYYRTNKKTSPNQLEHNQEGLESPADSSNAL
nr:PREDICTED: sperm protein associated with the nucleus on the X chromosome N2 [Equus przewalskii]